MKNIQFLESIKKMPLMALPVRSIFVQSGEGKILISPGSMLTTDQLKSLGHVTDLVAPNLLHCEGIPPALSVYPEARSWGAKGCQKAKPYIRWTKIISENLWPYQKELVFIPLHGMPSINEAVFFHTESRSLVVCDLCFNMTKASGLGAWIILHLFGTYRRFAVSRFFQKRITDKEAFEKSLRKVFDYDFENILLTHGENLMGDAKNKLAQALKERGYQVP